jgi:RNA polymerase-binding transcription factor DksA
LPRIPQSLDDRLAREERQLQRRLSALRHPEAGKLNSSSPHKAGSSDAFERAVPGASRGQHKEALWGRLAMKLQAITEARQRLREGTYGLCRECGAAIPRRRLEAMPTAVLCVPCQEKREATVAA